MPAEASQEERILLYRLNSKVVNSPYIANALNKLGKLAKRDSSPVATIADHRSLPSVLMHERSSQ